MQNTSAWLINAGGLQMVKLAPSGGGGGVNDLIEYRDQH